MASLNIDVEGILGNLELGVLIATVLFGTILVQTYRVLVSGSQAQRWMKPLVSAVAVLETMQTILLWLYLRFITVSKIGSSLIVIDTPWHLDLALAIFGFTTGPVRAFFTYRIYIISHRQLLLCIPLWFLELVDMALTFATAYMAYESRNILVFQERWGPLVYSTLIIGVVVDVANTVGLCWYLHSNSDGLNEVRQVSKKAMLYTVETGVLTCIAALAGLIFYIVWPYNGVWTATIMVYSKLYSNSLLACLNTRERLRERLVNDTMAVASSRRNTLRSTTNTPPRTPRDRATFAVDDVEIIIEPSVCDSFPLSLPKSPTAIKFSRPDSFQTDTSAATLDYYTP